MNQVIPGSEINNDDWVRFYRDGKLVIGVVEYFDRDWAGKPLLITDQGPVSEEKILEFRKPKGTNHAQK